MNEILRKIAEASERELNPTGGSFEGYLLELLAEFTTGHRAGRMLRLTNEAKLPPILLENIPSF